MRANEDSHDLSAQAEQLVKLSRQELGEMSTRRRAEGFLKLNARRSPAARRRPLALGFSALVLAAAFVLIGRHWFGPQRIAALTYAVQGGRIDSAGVLQSNGMREPTLRFSDGTTVVFLDGAHGQVKSVGERGARIALMGKANVAVVHSPAAQWLFDAGPFLITVTGTAFTAEWRDAEEQLEVSLRAGAIVVTGPLSQQAINLNVGQRLIVSMREKQALIRDLNATAGPNVVPSGPGQPRALGGDDLRSEPAASLAARSATPPSPGASGRPRSNWTSELAAGHFAIILQEAEQRGLETVLAEASSAELAALSDAARYSRREDVARRSLAAQRSRFPRSARANDAAFLLGRLEEAAQHPELALDWYERCLNEAPSGTYLSEALGRKMTVVQRLHGASSARPIAQEYLRRFKDGTYAAAARALTRAP